MSGAKTALKNIAAAIKAQKYEDAISEAQRVLTDDPKSFQAILFLGFAQNKISKFNEAEKAYSRATELRASDPQAWQGLIQVYEQQGAEHIAAYQHAAFSLAGIYEQLDDKYRCQDVVDKFMAFVKREGSRLQQKEAQKLILPTSPLYDYLEGRVPHPAHSYQIMAQITEFEEKEKINKEIGERRTRLGAKIGQVTTEVKREVFRSSDLEYLYTMIIDWATDDEVRRQYEEKLLQRCYDALIFLAPGEEKNVKRTQVLKLASDMVIIKHPFRLAWDIAIEWQDVENIQDLDVTVLREYCSFFPTSGLSHVLRGYMSSEICPFAAVPSENGPASQITVDSDESEDDDEGGGGVVLDGPLDPEDRLLIMIDGMADAAKSILAHRLMGEYYQFLEEYESNVPLLRNCRRLIQDESNMIGLSFANSSEQVASMLGTALVFYQSPKNHPEAREVFDAVLAKNPRSTLALIGYGYIFAEDEDYLAAHDFLERALQRDPSNVRVKVEAAWVKALNGNYAEGRTELESCLSQVDAEDVRSKELLAQVHYRIGICLWNLDTSNIARKDRQGSYTYFLAALKNNLNYAPAYTGLGIYYADYAKDRKRSRKCFQKAFELSASEIEAAERLARIFADQGEWDLVEVVAQRVVDSGKVKPSPGSKKKGSSWPYTALGVAELNKQDYAKCIVSFQSALRIAPDDYHSWVGLGESYHNSGRYIAATKAFQHAETFEHKLDAAHSGEVWFARHMLANVKRELGDYDEAITGYRVVLGSRPTERGVSLALVQSLADSALQQIERGCLGNAISRAKQTLQAAFELLRAGENSFNIWRAIGDASAIFSSVQVRSNDFPLSEFQEILKQSSMEQHADMYSDIDGVGQDVVYADGLVSTEKELASSLTYSLHSAIQAYKCAVSTSATDIHAQAVAYYNLGWAEYRAHICLHAILAKSTTRYLKTAIRCFKRAIELEAGNPEFWNALGVVTSELNPKVAQHAFVRSLYLNERNPQSWTNLGALYLLQNDLQLANEAFTRAQSNDPDYAHAWVGQGILALLMNGDVREGDILFTHAMEIDETSSLIAKRQYAQSTFDQLLSSSSSKEITGLVQPVFNLTQLWSMSIFDLPHRHLLSLFQERLTDVTEAMSGLATICAKVEADYEITESASSLSNFALAKADHARLQLSAGLYSEAIESAETAIQLSAEDSGQDGSFSSKSRQKCRLSAHLTLGLAHYHLEQADEAANYFTDALEESNRDPDATCLLAQVLWAQGEEEHKSQAREHLFGTIEEHPEHLQSILLLGVITLLEDDVDSIEAVTESLETLRASPNISEQSQTKISEVLRAFATLLHNGDSDGLIAHAAQTDIFLRPGHASGWGNLASTSDNNDFAGEMARKISTRAVPPLGSLSAEDLAQACGDSAKISDAQVATLLAPWKTEVWEVLSIA